MDIIVVTGSRVWCDKKTVKAYLKKFPKQTLLVHGNAKGLDRLISRLAKKQGIPVAAIDANWDFYHRAAGPIRNRWMLDLHPKRVDAFHKNIKKSKGTKDCYTEAKRRKIPVRLIRGLHDIRKSSTTD